MKKKYIICILLAPNITLYFSIASKQLSSYDFDNLMFIFSENVLNSSKAVTLLGNPAPVILGYFKNLYQKNQWLDENQTQSIPKIIHQIWLGSLFPEKYKKFQQILKKMHPDWKYKLWTDKDVELFNMKNKKLFNKSKNWGQKSDIWRYEILNRFGGVYIDVDVEMLKSLDTLNENYNFYAALEPLWEKVDTCLAVGNCIIGSVKDHPVLHYCIDKLIDSFNTEHKNEILNVVISTGPIFFTKACYTATDKPGYKDIILPSSYFFPSPSPVKNILKTTVPFCIHHWTHSWFPKGGKSNEK